MEIKDILDKNEELFGDWSGTSINDMLEVLDLMVRIGSNWYRLDAIEVWDDGMPIWVSDNEGGEHEFDASDIDEFDPLVQSIREMDKHIIGVA